MRFTRLVVTAAAERWVKTAASEFSGYGSSVIQCDAEVGVEGWLAPEETFDGRHGASLIAFGFNTEALGEAIGKRAGQCLMTCATTAVFDGYPKTRWAEEQKDGQAESSEVPPESQKRIPLGSHLRFFGDGFQKSKLLGDRRFWRIPVMDGEFIAEEDIGVGKGVAGGNFLIQSTDQMLGLVAAERAVDAIANLPNVITPFPGGIVRSGSKVGSRYKGLMASTFDAFCPTLKGRVPSKVHPEATCVYEIVINGTDFDCVSAALRTGIHAAVGEGVVSISAGNYGGKLGKHHFHLREILEGANAQGASEKPG